MWKAHDNRSGVGARVGARLLRRAGYMPARIYGNLARIATGLGLPYLGDNVRYLQMGLLAQELERRGVEGAIAELGVFRGDFTRLIARAFNNRKYYLFDTFEGFDAEQISQDAARFDAKGHDFSDTSVERVLARVDADATCEMIVRQGLFPDTAKGLEEQFAFVSIDVDLYEPTLEGLRYFYPRMAKGGYIMVHDLMADRYRGCREAIYAFCEAEGLTFVPLPDAICSALLVKS